MLDQPEIVQTTAQPTAALRLTIPRAEIQNVMGPGYREVMAAVAAQGIAPVGPWLTHHLRMDPDVFEFEICVPVAAPLAAAGRVQPGELRAATVARTAYHGRYEGLAAAWGEFKPDPINIVEADFKAEFKDVRWSFFEPDYAD